MSTQKCVFFFVNKLDSFRTLLIIFMFFHIMLLRMEGCSMAKSEKKKRSKFRYFIIFILFIGVGVGLGIFGTTKFLEYRENQENKPVVDDGPVEITDDVKYQNKIAQLRGILNGNQIFYSTKGLDSKSLDNTTKLNLLYDYMVSNNLSTAEAIDVDYIGSSFCKNGIFLKDVNVDVAQSSKCTVNRIKISELKSLNNRLFNDDVIDTSVSFNIGIDKKCIVDTDSYVCGNVTNVFGYIGKLESRFDVVKVTKDSDGTIAIFEKGYLKDNRSNVDNPTDQYDNYYLHSSDSKEYYYELKSADNLTFKHIFKTDDSENYYYVSSELVKE